ncbi:PBECR2 nuclease fold domain-containing protein [Arachidicoccus soli]|uniref:Phage head morphogenesis domain-containing protein n=1 Tax=Arachidicoccus soli TaxID=2341117 RepID=A0A386HRB6_9BACT|nr:PBECR2 nuclease fold domain-containing protein [Arachidicoccus soli]AYD48212.1 hypothetical protein D6B99_11750 [Arachidicoccus soli]
MAAGEDEELNSFLDNLASDLFNSRLPDGQIPEEMYELSTDKLFNALDKGLGGVSFDFEDERNSLKAFFQDNLAQFSAAKSLTELKFFNELLIKENGEIRSFNEFRDAVLRYGIQFNKNYLKTEYNTAVAAAQNARQFITLKQNGVQYLTYKTMEDGKVRPTHVILDDFTAHIDDPAWDVMTPPLAFNCRCYLLPGIASQVGVLLNKLKMTFRQLFRAAKVPKEFQNNPAKSKVIYTQEMPYFKQAKINGKLLQAQKNFGLRPILSDATDKGIYETYKFDAPVEFANKEEANKWWLDNAGTQRGSFDIDDNKGLAIRFDNKFRNHVIEQNNDGRETIIGNVKDILQRPDEVWSIATERKGVKSLQRTYIKYYKDFPMVVQVDGSGEAATMFEASKTTKEGKLLNKDSIENLRQGNLIYNKTR